MIYRVGQEISRSVTIPSITTLHGLPSGRLIPAGRQVIQKSDVQPSAWLQVRFLLFGSSSRQGGTTDGNQSVPRRSYGDGDFALVLNNSSRLCRLIKIWKESCCLKLYSVIILEYRKSSGAVSM